VLLGEKLDDRRVPARPVDVLVEPGESRWGGLFRRRLRVQRLLRGRLRVQWLLVTRLRVQRLLQRLLRGGDGLDGQGLLGCGFVLQDGIGLGSRRSRQIHVGLGRECLRLGALGLDHGERIAADHRLAGIGEDPGDPPRGRRADLHLDPLHPDSADRLIELHPVAGALAPARDRRLSGGPQLGHGELDRPRCLGLVGNRAAALRRR
jgi:hypothetical protein